MKKNIFYHDKDRLRMVGWIENNIFYRRIKKDIHLQHIWGDVPGIQKEVWDRIQNQVDKIMILSESEVFIISKDSFNKHKFVKDYGHGLQYFVNRKFWEKEYLNQLKLL